LRGECNCVDGRRGDSWYIEELGIDTNECPVNLVTGDSWGLLDLYSHYSAGFLPFDGGVMSQPQVFADAMRIIAAEVNSE